MAVPSVSAKKLASSPTMNSSITTSAPAAPKLPENMSTSAFVAWLSVSAMMTPLPAARPSALMTTGRPNFGSAARASASDAHIGGGRDVRPRAQVLGEAFGAFELRRRLVRPEYRHVRRAQRIGEAIDQRRFRADDDEVDIPGSAEGHHFLMVAWRRG
jgi:hypothetical protein